MKKAWKVILITALCILILGELVLGAGLLSGGSPERVWDKAYDHYNLKAAIEMWNDSVENGTLKQLADACSFDFPTFDIVEETPAPTATPKPTATPAPSAAPSLEPSAEPTATANP